jgi:hypothetical protein
LLFRFGEVPESEIMKSLVPLAFVLATSSGFAPREHHYYRPNQPARTNALVLQAESTAAVLASADSQLAQLASMTTLSIDIGDLQVIQLYASTGYITDATTNPLFVSQAGLSGDPLYANMVDDAVSYALQHTKNSPLHDDPSESATVSLAIDRLAVNLGKAIADIVPGYISTEVDPRLSFDTEASIQRGLRIIDMYETLGVPKSRVLIKLAATWEGILAAEQLQARGIQCNLTLVFSLTQAIACAQYGAHLISPFPGRYVSNATRRIYLTHFPKNLTLTTKTMQNPRLVQNERGPDARCRARAGRRCRRLS